MEYKAYALMAILLASVASVGTLGTAYAQTGFTVTTDKTDYTTGEDITVSGNVGTTPTGQPLLIQVFNPNGAAYRFDQVTVAADGSYTYTFRVGGNLGISGTYDVRVTYSGVTETTTFDFTAADGGMRTTTLLIDGEFEHEIQYNISGGTLRSLTGDSATATVTATITANRAGELTLAFPREVFDSVDSNGDDLDFIVFVDEIESLDVEDDFGATARTLVINFEGGSEQIDLVGTKLIPEFGAIAAIILAVSIVGIIVATTRYSKFSFLPKM
jgi:predicted secreted protein with PEFG-CTERM motif